MYNQSTEVLTNNQSVVTKSYFRSRLFSTGYATHGLFPFYKKIDNRSRNKRKKEY